jgi:CBS-domain-containing membrane protein
MNIGEVCTRVVVTATSDMSVAEAAALMRTHHVGNVIVIKETAGKVTPIGIVTDRDIVVEVVAAKVDPGALTAGEMMGQALVTARETEGLYEVLERMRREGIRRMPVIDENGALIGIVTLDDLLEIVAEEMNEMAKVISRERLREEHSRGRKQ